MNTSLNTADFPTREHEREVLKARKGVKWRKITPTPESAPYAYGDGYKDVTDEEILRLEARPVYGKRADAELERLRQGGTVVGPQSTERQENKIGQGEDAARRAEAIRKIQKRKGVNRMTIDDLFEGEETIKAKTRRKSM